LITQLLMKLGRVCLEGFKVLKPQKPVCKRSKYQKNKFTREKKMKLSLLHAITLKKVPLPKSYPNLENFTKWYYDNLTGEADFHVNDQLKYKLYNPMEMCGFHRDILIAFFKDWDQICD
jgi:hypothetical protein